MSAKKRGYTVEEYLQLEETSVDRHEYHAGTVFTMSSATIDHARINSNLTRAIDSRLSGTGCEVFGCDLKVRIPAEDRYVYPDQSIVCGPVKLDPLDRGATAIINPRVIVEVISELTEPYDRGEKFFAYLTLDSVKEYILIAHDQPMVESRLRQPDGTWLIAFTQGIERKATIRSLGLQIPLAEIYANITFEEPSES